MEKFVIVEINKSQFKVSEGDSIDVTMLDGQAGDKVTFDKILLRVDKDEVLIGKPYLEKKSIQAEIVQHFKSEKVSTLIYRAKSRYRKRSGNRQELTTIKILKIS